MGRRLYVGNLPYSAGEDDLRELFSSAGNVDTVSVVMDRETGRARGFAFVEMATDEEAQNAIAKLHDQQFGGRPLTEDEPGVEAILERPECAWIDRALEQQVQGHAVAFILQIQWQLLLKRSE